MTSRKILILLIVLISPMTFAKKKHRSKNMKPDVPFKYYYTLPVDASADWSYTPPECQSMSKDDYKLLTKKDNNCKSVESPKAEACLSLADVELKNSKTNEKKRFGLNYIIYDSMKSCQAEREKLGPATPAEGT
jgi:hypothetical protein